ncbi:MAG: HNH endonuclease signature motif containing protein [Gammaproteobacteria bacterium]
MRRCLNAVLDPHPSESDINQLWKHFSSSCAYCGSGLARDERIGHIDHVVPSASGGTNDIHNHVLSCARCNGDEKREESWETFLARKATSGPVYQERRAHIQVWLNKASPTQRTLSPTSRAQADAIIEQALGSFDCAVKELRALRNGRA